jgi:dolichol-phosphate mannosyltransferase
MAWMSIGVRCLITGATGFVGANLVHRLVSDGHDCHLILRPEHNDWRLKPIQKQVSYHILDMRDKVALKECLASARPEWIFHLAANGAYSWQNNPDEIFSTNLLLLNNLLEVGAETGFRAFVNAGSSSEYGFKNHPPSEDDAAEPNSYYAIAKVAATHLCKYLAKSKSLPIVTLRLYSVYGPYEDAGRLIPTIVREGLQGRLPVLVSPEVARDYVYVDDVCQAFLNAATKLSTSQGNNGEPGAIFNIGSGKQTSVREVVEIAKNLMKIQAEPQWGTMENRQWDTSTWVGNVGKAKAQLGWQAQMTFVEGLEKTIAWTRERHGQVETSKLV